MGQEEFYGEQYGHTANSSEPTNQQYYPDGNHTDPHTHSCKQSTCLFTAPNDLPHLLLLPRLIFPYFSHLFAVYSAIHFSPLIVSAFGVPKFQILYLLVQFFPLFYMELGMKTYVKYVYTTEQEVYVIYFTVFRNLLMLQQ